MKRTRLSIFTLLVSIAIFAQEKPFVVPTVENWKAGKGELQWNQLNSISYNDAVLQDVAQYLSGFTGKIPATLGKGGFVSLQLCKDKKLGAEGYQLIVTTKGITIKAQTEQGILWGIQTLQQLKGRARPSHAAPLPIHLPILCAV